MCCKDCAFLCYKRYEKTGTLNPYCNFYNRLLVNNLTKVNIEEDYCKTFVERPKNYA